MADVLLLPPEQREVLIWMMRRGAVSVSEAAAQSGQDETTIVGVLALLATEGYANRLETENDGVIRYQARLAQSRRETRPRLDLTNLLDK